MKVLVVIPARGGSKGIPGKNIKSLNGKALICYAIDAAREVADDFDICVTTDDEKIKQVVEEYGLDVPFLRPDSLADDKAGMNEVLIHAYQYFKDKGRTYDVVLLLQPTSPFRKTDQIKEAITLYDSSIDMVVSVKEPVSNPYYITMKENENGYLEKALPGKYVRRQDCPVVYEYNGAIYVINVASLLTKGLGSFDRKVKYEMDEISSHDLDNPMDWQYCEFLLDRGIVTI